MTSSGQQPLHQDFPVPEILRERQRLEQERGRLTAERDHLYTTVVGAGDDSGYSLMRVLKQLKQVEQRITVGHPVEGKGLGPLMPRARLARAGGGLGVG
jgi:hypothetical protein